MQGRIDEPTIRRLPEGYRGITATAIGPTNVLSAPRFNEVGEGQTLQGIQYTQVSQNYGIGQPVVNPPSMPSGTQPTLMIPARHTPPLRPDIHTLPIAHQHITPAGHLSLQHTGLPHSALTVSQVINAQQLPTMTVPSVNQAYLVSGSGAGIPVVSQQQQQQQQQFQRLKVEDALSYLDQVKLQFGNHPQVYNDFLDIMKEFKSQSIDTPGVISRVSNLFKGHPDLIVGFNTFLPPGYKIEIQDGEHISVHQPGQEILSINTGASALSSVSKPIPPHPSSTSSAVNSVAPTLVTPQPTHRPTHESVPVCVTQYPSAPQHQIQQPQPNQPVEFNHAINYVNKIKNRFHGQPEIYKSFLEILHTYQKEQRNIKEGMSPSHTPLTETEVYEQVAKLFSDQKDLLDEFGQFLPDANGSATCLYTDTDLGIRNDHSAAKKPTFSNKAVTKANQLKRPLTSNIHSTQKKMKLSGVMKDVSFMEAAKHGSLKEFAFFDKVRKALRNQDAYNNFLRCLLLFNQEVVSRSELVQIVHGFLGKFPDLLKWFKDFLGYKEAGGMIEPIPYAAANKERINNELAMEIDFTTCKKYGASYRALPKSYPQPKCSGRTALCREVLNDTWVSFPSWSEDSTFVTSRKTQYEENIYRCEDERFELDIVLETNAAAVHALEAIQKKISHMSGEEGAKFKLDNCLGGNSEVLHRKAIQRIYGDKATDIIEGIKKNPLVAVPLVLRRLKAKEEEWREAQQSFNKLWREQNEKYYLKSLDHQGINFKQSDVKFLRSKSLLNEIETIFDERQEQNPEGNPEESSIGEPHMTLIYRNKSVIEDTKSLILHHMKRQAAIHKEDKSKIKQLLHHFLPDFFSLPRGELSDDEPDDMDVDENEKTSYDSKSIAKIEDRNLRSKKDSPKGRRLENGDISDKDENTDNSYQLFFVNNNWYLFFRLHNLLCERITKIVDYMDSIIEEQQNRSRNQSTAIALRLKSPNEIEPKSYHNFFLDMVKNVLDGNLDSIQYEDQLREMFGIHAYITFTMDKLVQNIVRQLHHIVSDDTCLKMTQLFHSETLNKATGGAVRTTHQRFSAETTYQRRAEQIVADENCYKLLMYKKDCRLTIELLDTDHEQADEPVEVARWSDYTDRYVANGDTAEYVAKARRKARFLARNPRKIMLQNDGEENSKDQEQRDNDLLLLSMDNKNVEMMENTECRFNLSTFKMVFVVGSGSFLYRRSSLSQASQGHKSLTSRLNDKFKDWVNRWCESNVTPVQRSECDNWLMGKATDMQSCETTRTVIDHQDVTPYHPFHKYSVKYHSEMAD